LAELDEQLDAAAAAGAKFIIPGERCRVCQLVFRTFAAGYSRTKSSSSSISELRRIGQWQLVGMCYAEGAGGGVAASALQDELDEQLDAAAAAGAKFIIQSEIHEA
jgi:hypothetical protein